MNCPCGRNKKYEDCCALPHKDLIYASRAEDLMRSRYTAFTKGMGDYLMISHHSSTRPVYEKDAIEKWARSVKWMKLEVLNAELGGENDDTGTVEFKAHFKERGRRRVIHEKSRFVRENGVWTYLDAI